ncbi:unnamed protein product [Phytophthora lilii]|uniref:Unnamed protein product n=1 Tax=Phytophthora lilii TaxID=2077276 RepID=A0A9W6WTT0_9STRA|nr:unnamed protein product [Phytophthora lilii]
MFLSTTDNVLLSTKKTTNTTVLSTSDGGAPAEPQLASSKMPTETIPVDHHHRNRFQRQRSRSLHELEEAYEAATKPADAPEKLEQQKMFERTLSQSHRTLTKAIGAHAPPRGSIGSISTAHTRILQRMNTFVADASGQSSNKPSPTQYADALFKMRETADNGKDK